MLTGQTVVELRHDSKFIGMIAGADGPGVRIITKHAVKALPATDDGSGVNVFEMAVVPE